METDRRPTKVT